MIKLVFDENVLKKILSKGRSFFWRKFTNSFCKLELFIKMPQILLMFIKWSSLHKSVSKFTPKKFYEIDPWLAIEASLVRVTS